MAVKQVIRNTGREKQNYKPIVGMETSFKPETYLPAALQLAKISRSFAVKVFEHQEANFLKANHILSNISLVNGELFIDGQQILKPQFGRDFVRFAQSTPSGFISGVLNFTKDGHAFSGRIYRGDCAENAVPHDIAGVTPPTVYSTKICRSGEVPPQKKDFPEWNPPEPEEESSWEEGLNFTLGYEFNEQEYLPKPIYRINGTDISDFVAPIINPKNGNLMLIGDLVISGVIQAAIEEIGANVPAYFKIEFAWDAMSFKGVVGKFDVGQGKILPEQYLWKGNVKSFQLNAPKALSYKSIQNQHALGELSSVEIKDLSIAELYTLQADNKELQENQFNMLVQNMKWALSKKDDKKDWLKNFFGEQPPDLSAARTELIKQDLDFYTEKFAVVYLGHSFNKMSGDAAPTTRLSVQESRNLDFYLRAGLASEKAYTKQTYGVFLQAFTESVPRLKEYIKDQNANKGPDGRFKPDHDWAQKLYDQITQPQMINIAYNKLIAGEGMQEINRHSTVLSVLQPSGELAQKYHKIITCRTLSASFDHLDLDDANSIKAWLVDSLEAFVNTVLNGKVEGIVDPATYATMRYQAEKIQEAATKAKGFYALGNELADLIVTVSGKDIWEKLANAQTAWAKAGYRFAQSIYCLAYMGALGSCIIAFQNWSNLKPEQKAAVWTITFYVTIRIIAAMPEAITSASIGVRWTFQRINRWYWSIAGRFVNNDILTHLEAMNANAMRDGAMNIRRNAFYIRRGPARVGIMNIEGSAWRRTFNKNIDVVCKYIGVAVSAAFAVISTYTFIKGIIDGKSMAENALDGVIMAANIGMLFCAVASLFVGATIIIPVIGAIFAVIGIIASLIEMFLPKKNESPVESFMADQLKPAVIGGKRWILEAPNGWTADEPVPEYNAYNPEPAVSLA